MRRRIHLLLRLPTLARARRPAAVALVVMLALTAFAVVNPIPARADALSETPRLTVEPPCVPTPQDSDSGTLTVTVRGYSFQAGRSATIHWNGAPAPAPADVVTVGPAGAFEVIFTVSEIRSATSYAIDAYYVDDPSATVPVASTGLEVIDPCPSTAPSISISPTCVAANTAVPMHITGTGFQPNEAIAVHVYDLYSQTVDYTQYAPAVPPDPNAVAIDLTVTVPVVGGYRVVADQTPVIQLIDSVSPATAYFVAPCPQVTLSTTCGSMGSAPDRYTITLSGAGFQPKLPISIAFDLGGQPEFFNSDFVVNDDGSWGPADINPYERPVGSYGIVVRQFGDGFTLHDTDPVGFVVECSSGTVTLNPTCAAPYLSGDQASTFPLTVAGSGFQPSSLVTITFDPQQLSGSAFPPERVQAPTDSAGSFSAPLTIAARPANTYVVSVEQQVGSTTIEGVVPPFPVPCAPSSPTLTASPACGSDVAVDPSSYSISLVGKRFLPGFVQIVFDVDGSQEQFQAEANANGRFSARLNPSAKPPGTYRIEARQLDINQTLLSDAFVNDFVVPCTSTGSPVLTIMPAAVSPGFVVDVRGTGFPAGQTIELSWSSGIGASKPIEVIAGDDGSFDRQVLIFDHDFAGPREMTAGTKANPDAFPDATADVVVMPGQGSPPSYVVVGGGSTDPGSIVLRR